MKIPTIYFIVALMCIRNIMFAQVGINTDNSAPDPSAGLDVNFNNKGLLPPRMTTTQMNAILSPAAGLMVFNTTLNTICWFDGTVWNTGTNLDNQNCGTVIYGGKTYNSIIIGNQCWMGENLNIGVAILSGQHQTNNGAVEKYCYNNNLANCDLYGGLYQWAEAVQYLNGATNTTSWNPVPTGPVQGICPSGWHLPTEAEWTILGTYLGGLSVAGGKIKERGTLHWAPPNIVTVDSTGFTALPGGELQGHTTVFYLLTINAKFWALDEQLPDLSNYWYMFNDNPSLIDWGGVKETGLSVRCLKD